MYNPSQLATYLGYVAMVVRRYDLRFETSFRGCVMNYTMIQASKSKLAERSRVSGGAYRYGRYLIQNFPRCFDYDLPLDSM